MNIQHIAEFLNLKKSGGEYKGPCPKCGGHDRFHIKEGKQQDLIFLCRHGCTYAEIMQLLERWELVPKDDRSFVRPVYRQSDLMYCDSLMMVVEADLDRQTKFTKNDLLAMSHICGKVDQTRKDRMRQLIDQVRMRVDG